MGLSILSVRLKVYSGPFSILSCTQRLDAVVRAEKKHLIASNKNQKTLHVMCITDKIGFKTHKPSTYGHNQNTDCDAAKNNRYRFFPPPIAFESIQSIALEKFQSLDEDSNNLGNCIQRIRVASGLFLTGIGWGCCRFYIFGK